MRPMALWSLLPSVDSMRVTSAGDAGGTTGSAGVADFSGSSTTGRVSVIAIVNASKPPVGCGWRHYRRGPLDMKTLREPWRHGPCTTNTSTIIAAKSNVT